jgi:two-component system, LuxR family, sensor kinase FixL
MSEIHKRSRLRLLLIEDDPAQLAILAKFLRREDFDVVTCTGLEQALKVAQGEAFAVAVVDLDLNGDSGLEFARVLVTRQEKTRVIIHTAYSTFESMRDGLNLGVFAYVEKLSDFSQLIEYVHRAASAYLYDNLNAAKEEIVLQLRLLDAVDQGIMATNLEGQLIYWNQYAESLTRIGRSEAVGQGLFDYVLPCPEDKAVVSQSISEGRFWQGECEAILRPGDQENRHSDVFGFIPVRLVLSPIVDTRGLTVGAVGSFRDISIERASEQKLANRAKLLAISAELGRSAVEMSDRDDFLQGLIHRLVEGFPLDHGRILFSMPGKHDLTTVASAGVFPEDLTPRWLQADSLEVSCSTLSLCMEHSLAWEPTAEVKEIREPRIIRGFRAPFCQENKVVGCLEGFFLNQRLTSEDEFDFIHSISSLVTGVLQRDLANRLWQSLFDNALEAVMIADDEGRYVNMNDAACEMFGYSRQDLSQKTLSDLMTQESLPVASFKTENRQELTLSKNEIELIRRDQTTIIAEIGTIANILPGINLSVLRDITKSKQSDHIISQQNDQLSHVQRLATMGNLAAFLAHEINQPLGTISLLSGGLMLSREASRHQDQELLETLELIGREALKAGSIVNRLRRFISLDSFEPVPVDANQVIRETIKVLRNYFASVSVTVRLNLQESLPQVKADPIRLEQVFVNFIRNAVEAMSEIPAEERYIDIETQADENFVSINFNDCGPKLTEAQFSKLMTPYYSTKAEGLGMGLCISRSIIEQHNGTLVMKQLAPKGMQGSVTLPIMESLSG